MGIDTDIDRSQPWGIVPGEVNMTGGGAAEQPSSWPPDWENIDPAQPGGGISHPQVMSRVALGF